MEVLNKILPLILTAIMSVNLSGCGNTNSFDQSAKAIEVTARSEINIDKSSHKYDEVVKFDITSWELSDIASNIEFDNFSFSLPTSIQELENHFLISDTSRLYYESEWIGEVNIKDETVIGIILFSDTVYNYNVKVGNIQYDTPYDTIIQKYGEQNSAEKYQHDGMLVYTFRNGSFIINTNDTAYKQDSTSNVTSFPCNSFTITFVDYT